jgi:hypothetical protein
MQGEQGTALPGDTLDSGGATTFSDEERDADGLLLGLEGSHSGGVPRKPNALDADYKKKFGREDDFDESDMKLPA